MNKGVKRKSKNQKTNIVRTPGRKDLSHLTGVTPNLKVGKIFSIFIDVLMMPIPGKVKASVDGDILRIRGLSPIEDQELEEWPRRGMFAEWPYNSDQDLYLELRRQEDI